MKHSPTLRAVFYLLLSLSGMLLGALFPEPFSALFHLVFVLLAVFTEKTCFAGAALPRFACRGKHFLWLIFPAFCFFTLGANLLSSYAVRALGGTLPAVVPSVSLFVGAVVIAPIAEELLFRGLLLRLFEGYGERFAILLSAVLFALAHGNLFQMPYALVAGVLLGYTATLAGGLFFPLAFHFLYNLLAFFGGKISPLLLFSLLGGAALVTLFLLWKKRRLSLPKGGAIPTGRALLPLLFYGALMLTFILLKEFV